MATWKFERIGLENFDKARAHHPQGAFLQAFWHEHILSYTSAQAWTLPFMALISRSKDGDFAAIICRKMGFTPVRGSSRGRRGGDKGGRQAMDIFIENMGLGFSGGMTVDGPKGPRHVCKPGVVLIAEQTGAMIVPGTAVPDRYWEFKSWDKFKVPKPFARIRIVYSEPITVAKGSSQTLIAETCKVIEKKLNELEENYRWI
jgi:lysophospholipid acyltransferase (LPLAT)-like uncharacterized protein